VFVVVFFVVYDCCWYGVFCEGVGVWCWGGWIVGDCYCVPVRCCG